MRLSAKVGTNQGEIIKALHARDALKRYHAEMPHLDLMAGVRDALK